MNRQQIQARVRAGSCWYRITNAAGEVATVVIYDEIGWFGVSAASFMDEVRDITAPAIDLRLNSPGGDVFDGVAIHNVLRSHPANVTTYVDSLAASIASVIALAGDKVVMQPHSQLMIHESAGLAIGDADEMRHMADLLDRQSDNIAGIYAERAGGDVATWREAMRAETWYTAQEAVDAGLADAVAERPRQPEPGDPPENRWDLSIFNYAGRAAAPPPAPKSAPPVKASHPRLGWLYA